MNKPEIVCLVGSTRFGFAFRDAEIKETLDGNIVLSIGCNMRSDKEIFGHLPESELQRIKAMLDELHLRKIDLSDRVTVINVGGYVGSSTKSEIEYAQKLGKPIRYLEALKKTPEEQRKAVIEKIVKEMAAMYYAEGSYFVLAEKLLKKIPELRIADENQELPEHPTVREDWKHPIEWAQADMQNKNWVKMLPK